jgi:hypothetical protein
LKRNLGFIVFKTMSIFSANHNHDNTDRSS